MIKDMKFSRGLSEALCLALCLEPPADQTDALLGRPHAWEGTKKQASLSRRSQHLALAVVINLGDWRPL